MFEIKVEELYSGSNALTGVDGLELPAAPGDLAKLAAPAGRTQGRDSFAACSYRFRMDILNGFITGEQRLDVLNQLAEQLAGMMEYERILFEGAVGLPRRAPGQVREPLDACLSLCRSLSRYELIPHVGNSEQRGRYAAKHELAHRMAALPPEIQRYLNYQRLGELLADPAHETFVSGHLVRDRGRNDAVIGMDRWDGCVLKLLVASASVPEGTWLKLPLVNSECELADSIAYCIALEKLEVEDVRACQVIGFASEHVPGLERCLRFDEPYTTESLLWSVNCLGITMANMLETADAEEILRMAELFQAALRFEKCEDMNLAHDILCNLSCYRLYHTSDPAAAAEAFLTGSGLFGPDDRPLLDAIDFKEYAKAQLACGGCVETEYGLIFKAGDFAHDFYSPSPCRDGQQMGGLT